MKRVNEWKWWTELSCLAVLLIAGASCTHVKQQYFIEVQECRSDWSVPHSSFIRLDLDGKAFLTQSQIQAGWYENRALDLLFSTQTLNPQSDINDGQSDYMSTSREGLDCAKRSDNARNPTDAHYWRRTLIYGPNGREIDERSGKRLVIFVASNPNAIVNRISTTVNTMALSDQVGQFISREQREATDEADEELASVARRHHALALDSMTFLETLAASERAQDDESARKMVKDRIKALINKIDTALQK